MVIFDTSVWIDYFKGVRDDKTNYLEHQIAENGVLMLGVILQEILQGIRDESQFKRIEKNLLTFTFLDNYSPFFYSKAAQLYRSLRQKGVTIRKPNDCFIAVYALHFDIELCHNDSDFDQISEYYPLKSPRF